MRLHSTLATGSTVALVGLLLHCTDSAPAGSVGDASPGDTSAADATAAEGASADAGPIDTGTGEATESGGNDGNTDGLCRAPTADGGASYGPDDPNIQYSGRIDFADVKHPRFAASATYVRAKFRGSSVKVSFTDENRYGGFNFFDVIVDDLPAVKITPAIGMTTYDATPPGLCNGVHTVTFVKRTEADTGFTTFLGFAFDGVILPNDPKPVRRIEIVGDSITCGAGVEAASPNAMECFQNGLSNRLGMAMPGYGQGVENGDLAYGPMLARQFNAEWHVTCASGIGLVRNYYSRGDQRTMPVIYPFLFPEDTANSTVWDPTHTQWIPDVIVIGLGTNDFSRDSGDPNNPRPPMPVTGIDGGVGLVEGYIQFIDELATSYPGVNVVLVSSPILGNAYPTPGDMQLTDHATAIRDVVAHYASDGGAPMGDAGGPSVHVFAAIVDKLVSGGTGCLGHPSVTQQADATKTIAPVIKAATGW